MESPRVVIVGAGMAGLTAAAYLARQDYNVLLLDKNSRSGGLVHTFDYAGFSFDAGPRAFVNSGIVKPILNDLGIAGDFAENKLCIGIEDQLFRVESMDSLEEYERVLKALYPEDGAAIDEIIAAIEMLSGYTEVLYEFDNPNFTNVLSDVRLIFRQLIPWTVKFLIALRQMNRFSMPMETFLEGMTDNQSLIDVLTQLFFRRTPTYFALGYFYVYLDYFYPRGGTGALADLLREKALSAGTEMRLSTTVTAVTPSEGKVTDSEGNSYGYDHLIWAADLKTLYRNVNAAGLDAATAQQIETQSLTILAARGAESVFILFMAVDRPPAYFRARGGEHMFYTPSREGLGDTIRARRQRLIENFDAMTSDEVVEWLDESEIPVVNTLKDIPKSVLTPIPGVLQAGQWSYSPSGVPIAMLTGWYASQEIVKRSRRG